jgi:phosphoglycolate phosphatase
MLVQAPMPRQAGVSGRTKPDIFRDTLALHGIDHSEEALGRFADAMAAGYAAKEPTLRARTRLAGAAAVLAALDHVRRVVQSVLTGNF